MRKHRVSTLTRTHQAILAGVLGACTGLALAATPKEQKAIVQTGNGGPEVLQLQTVPVLAPGPGQVLIKVYAAAVNPVDWKRREGSGRGAPPGAGTALVSFIPGFDVAGVVEKTGSAVTQFKAGDAVLAMLGRDAVTGLNGGYAEYAIAAASNVIAKPKSLTYEQAAGLATTGVTAARAVIATDVSKGQRVFINGIAGGVGSAAAQIAKARGAYVIGTASAKHHAYLKSIGVDEAIDYTQLKFEDAVKQPVDVVIETVGAETATRALKILKKGGTLFSVAGNPSAEQCAAAGVNCGGPRGPNDPSEGELLTEVAKLADAGRFQVNVDAGFPLERAAAAQEENRNGGTQGKIIIDVAAVQAKQK